MSYHQLFFYFKGRSCMILMIHGRHIFVLLKELILCLKSSNYTPLLITGSYLILGRYMYTHRNLLSDRHLMNIGHLIKIRHYLIHIFIFVMVKIIELHIHLLIFLQGISLILVNVHDIFGLGVLLHFNSFPWFYVTIIEKIILYYFPCCLC